MTYLNFATVYDELMSNAPYEKWVQFVQESCRRYHPQGKKALDLGCGTGTVSALLSDVGFQMTGVDRSANMLALAREKSKDIHFVEQDMTKLDLMDVYDLVVIFCDSLNYLTNEKDVIATFERVFNHLAKDGLLLFDVHSPYKVTSIFKDSTFAYESEDVAYVWECFVEEENRVEHELTFFVKQEVGLYERFDELHVQKTFPIDTYKQMLERTGFSLLEVSADFTRKEPNHTSERIFFVAKKGICK